MTTDIVTTRKIGTIIRNRRKELGFSQEQLSEKVGVSYQQIQRYENGGSMLNVENLQRVAKALLMPVGLFFEDFTAQRDMGLDTAPIISSEEKTLLKHFQHIESNPDRQALLLIARRLAAKK